MIVTPINSRRQVNEQESEYCAQHSEGMLVSFLANNDEDEDVDVDLDHDNAYGNDKIIVLNMLMWSLLISAF